MSTAAYANLDFAWGHARLRDQRTARDLLALASAELQGGHDVHRWLLRAFAYRIHEALQGHAHAGPFPADLQTAFEQLDANRYARESYAYMVERMRTHSQILEPDTRIEG